MVALSVQIETAGGLNWSTWKQLVAEVEALGFAGLFCCDHFTAPMETFPDALEMIVAMTYLADHTARVHFGPLVAPVSFRDPVMLARQAAAIDDLSGGRMILGVGAGWMEREHTMFGYDLGDLSTRMARFAEGLEVMSLLLREPGPVTFEGRFFRLHDAVMRPRPQHERGPLLLIGGNGPRRTLPLAARYADVWNGVTLTPDEFQERCRRLDGLLSEAGRRPEDVRRTMQTPVCCGRDRAELDRQLNNLRILVPDGQTLSLDEMLNLVSTHMPNTIVGTPDEVVARIKAYEQAGLQELMLQRFDLSDMEGLRLLADHVLPYV